MHDDDLASARDSTNHTSEVEEVVAIDSTDDSSDDNISADAKDDNEYIPDGLVFSDDKDWRCKGVIFGWLIYVKCEILT